MPFTLQSGPPTHLDSKSSILHLLFDGTTFFSFFELVVDQTNLCATHNPPISHVVSLEGHLTVQEVKLFLGIVITMGFRHVLESNALIKGSDFSTNGLVKIVMMSMS